MKYTIDITGPIIPNDVKFFYEFFGEDATCPADVKEVLDGMVPGDEVEIYINSPGGVVDAGSEIYTAIRKAAQAFKVTNYVVGEACSAASVIACSAYCEMSPTALMMVHCVSGGARGNHNDLEKAVEVLKTADKAICAAYVDKTGMSEEEALTMMEEETWLTATEAKERGLVDDIMFAESEPEQLVAANAFKLPTEAQMAQVRALMEQEDMNTHEQAKDAANARLRVLRAKRDV